MIPEKKQKIIVAIAEAMGPIEVAVIDGLCYRMYDGLYFDPVDSDSDALRAVHVIADGKYYSIQIQHHPFKEKHEKFGVFLKIERFFKSGGSRIIQTLEFAETRPAAVSLALAEFLKEK